MSQVLRQPAGFDAEQKLRALDAVVNSNTFARSEQLRRFLRYVGEMEAGGRGATITEYSIGVEGLGRPPSFVPSDDGIVRNRAHALRQKLLEYYARENPGADVVIELPRGSYVPRFQPGTPPVADFPPTPDPARSISAARVHPVKTFLLGFGSAAILALAIAAALLMKPAPVRIDPIVKEAWGPIAREDADATLVLSYPYHLVFRQFPPNTQPKNALLDARPPADVEKVYREHMPPFPGDLHMQWASAMRLGEVLGLVSALKVMHGSGASYQVVHDRAVTLTGVRDRNAVVFGDPNMTPLVARFLEKGYYSIEYSGDARDFVIHHRGESGSTPRSYQASPRKPTELREFPGLLTVLPSDGSNGRKRTVIFAGANSSGAQAAAEFFSSPSALRTLKERFAKEGIGGFPQAYQVVLKGVAEGQSVLSYSYQEHHILAR